MTEERDSDRRLTLGYLAPNLSDSVGQARWQGVLDLARERGANLLCFPGSYWRDATPAGMANVLYDLVSPESLDGLILGNIVQEDLSDRNEFERYYQRRLGLPAVSLRRIYDGIPYVPLDNYEGMREAVAHLVEVHGLRRIAFLRGPEEHPYARERYQAYLDVLQAHDLPHDPALVTPASAWNAPALGTLMDERGLVPGADFDAVVAVNDRKALDALRNLQARGVRVPEGVAIVGFNDDAEDRAVTPPLTSVAMPFYEQGRRAGEMLLAMLEGEEVPEQVSLPARLVVRQSCGCLSPDVAHAAAPPGAAEQADLGAAVQVQRQEILDEMVQTVGDSEVAPEEMEHLLDAFVAEILDQAPGTFLSTLNEALRLETADGGDVRGWQGVVSALRRYLLPYLDTVELLSRADGLWQQARVLIGQVTERVQARQVLEAGRQAETLQRIGQALSTSLDLEELTRLLVQDLPQLGIPSGYLSLYEDPSSPAESARLILAFDASGRLQPGLGAGQPEADAGQPGALAWRFRPTDLVPGELLPERRWTFVVEPLYFRQNHLGIILFEVGPREGSVYEVLRGQISSVLQGAALIEQTGARALLIQGTAEVSRVASSILDPGELIDRVVNLIRERFDLYYVGLFLVDRAESAAAALDRWAYHQAGTGEAGREMRRRRHRLRVGDNSMVGQCLSTGEPRIALDADKEVMRFANPLLPETQSELALPLVSRGQMIGALSIQSARKGAFSEESIAIFQTMASQLANSIENAYLLEETQRAMEELKAIQRRYIREGWSRYLDRDR